MQKAELTQPEPMDFAGHPEVIASFKNILGEIETVIELLQRENLDFELLVKTNQGLLQDLRLAISKYPEAEAYYQQHSEEFGELDSLETLFEASPKYIEENRGDFINHFKTIHQCIERPLNTSPKTSKQLNYKKIKILRGHQQDVRDVKFSPDGEKLASASEDGTVRLWQQPIVNYVPQGISNDLAQGDDQLSIEDEIQAIADVLLLRQLEPPIAVGILGTWGSGKSFGMHLIQKRVNEIRCEPRQKFEAWGDGLEEDDPDREKKLSPYVGHIYQIKFNAWSYAKQDLWASLMEGIFSELNHQMTLERQLQKAGVDLLTGGKLWEALEKLNAGDRQYFLEQQLDTETYEHLRKIELKSDLNNELMTTLRRSQNQALKDIKDQEALSKELNQSLKERQCEIAEGMDNNLHVALESAPELLQQLHRHFGKNIELKITERIRDRDPDFDPQNFSALFDTFGDSINIFLGDRRPDVYSSASLMRWLKKSWQPLAWFVGLFILCIVIPWKLAPWIAKLIAAKSEIETWKNILSVIGIITPGTPALIKLKELLSRFNQWSEEAKLAVEEAKVRVQQAMEAEIAKDPQVQSLQQQLTILQKQIEQKRQALPELNYDSLAEFLGDRLKPENYTNHLEMINQVQKDLQDLSDKLLPPKEKRDEKIKELFPRGEPRVILYIDDLDRCPPKRVVEVLEAVQLLLKTQLFVVVLAVDDRYVARALEEVYSGVLKRRGKPSGIDYLEKIIQIPYRMRPISADTVAQYLSSQIQVIPKESETEIVENPNPKPALSRPNNQPKLPSADQSENAAIAPIAQTPKIDDISLQQQTSAPQIKQAIDVQSEPLETASNINEINTIEKTELDLIVECCKYVDITPRTGKRLINIYKILKIIWEKRQHQGEPSIPMKRTMFSFLALSGRYPDFMRNLFEEIDTEFQESPDLESQKFDLIYLLYKLKQQVSSSDSHAQREWRKFASDIKRMIHPNPFTLDKNNFELALAFCFVGDIGYDPDDFSQDPIMPTQQ